MGLMDYIKPAPSKSAVDVRELMKDKDHGEYNIIDVRQPVEYNEGHIPGALLIPMSDLKDRIHEIDPDKPTIAY